MLIVLDQSLVAALQADPSPQSDVAIAIDTAAEAFRRGIHVLHGEISVLDQLAKLTKAINPRTASLLVRARGKAPYRRALLETVKWFVRVTNDVLQPQSGTCVFGNLEIALPASSVAQSPALFGKHLVIAENLNDAFFYEGLSRAILKSDPHFKRHFSETNLQYQAIPGGGHTIAQIYLHEKTLKEHFCLAVVDSDKSWPGARIGITAAALYAIDAPPNSSNWNARQLMIGVRAIENIIPHDHFLAAAKSIDPAIGIKAQASISRNWGKICWEYFPHKKGMLCFDLKANNPESQYWRNEIGFGHCPNFSPAKCDKREDCKTTIVEPLSTALLAKVCEVKPVALSLDPTRDDFIFGAGRNLANEMLSALCADIAVL